MRLDDRGRQALPGRRRFLFTASLAAVALAIPRRAAPSAAPRSLSFVNIHTDEKLSAVYWADGALEPQALCEIDHILRDYRTGDIKPIDVTLLDLLHDLRALVGSDAPFHVISGYRSPATNAMLRAHSEGVARHSLHLDAKAADVRLPGVALLDLRRAALSLQRGGVGYYPGPEFVHVDTGRVRAW
jgi:uncharacterized protein YcbK (DUF882 family)